MTGTLFSSRILFNLSISISSGSATKPSSGFFAVFTFNIAFAFLAVTDSDFAPNDAIVFTSSGLISLYCKKPY